MYSTRVTRHIHGSPDAVFRALTERDAIALWRVPEGMHADVHEFDARVGGTFRVSLTYDAEGTAGKSSARTDTYHGRFLELLPGERVVEELWFEADDPELQGRMTMSTTLSARDGGTDVMLVHDGVPDAVPAAENQLGMEMALAKLAALVESAAG